MTKFNITDLEDSLTYGVFDTFKQVILEEIEKGNTVAIVRKFVNATEEQITISRTMEEFTKFNAPYEALTGMPG